MDQQAMARTSATAARRPRRTSTCRATWPSIHAPAISTSPTCTTTGFARWMQGRTRSRRSPAAARGAIRATTDRGRRRGWPDRPGRGGRGGRPGGGPRRARAERQGDDLHCRLLQRPRPRGRARRHHPRPERRGPRSVRRADAPRLRSAPRVSLRRRLEPGSRGAADHSEDRPEPRAAAAAAAAAQGGWMSERVTEGLLGWVLTSLRPYRGRVALLTVLLVSEIGLGALQPWPLAIVIDYVLGSKPFP